MVAHLDTQMTRGHMSVRLHRGVLEMSSSNRDEPSFRMAPPKKKRKVSDLTVEDANTLLRTLAEFQAQLDEEDEDLPKGLIAGLEELRQKLQITPVDVGRLHPLLCLLS